MSLLIALLDQRESSNFCSARFQYFKNARQLIDITDCRDLTSLQAILFMILFLQSSAKMSTCYSYIGVALRSSLRMGLHRSVTNEFNPIERETRKRIFWVVRKMDIYVGALIGLPQMLSDDDIDQDQPAEIDDECIRVDGVTPMPEGQVSLLAASNAHTRLIQILQQVVKSIYPTKGLEHAEKAKNNRSYVVSHTRIQEIERMLQQWMEDLPMALRPSDGAPPHLTR